MNIGDQAGISYEEFIREQLTEERARKQSLEQRGLAVVTSSGTLVTLLIAVTALARGPGALPITVASKVFFWLAVLSFTAAGILGIFTNRPELYEEASTDWLKRLVWPSVWTAQDLSLAKRRTTEARLRSIETFREVNQRKATLLTRAIVSEVAAVALVALGIIALFL